MDIRMGVLSAVEVVLLMRTLLLFKDVDVLMGCPFSGLNNKR
jgi:hypothetical protein